jgi:hypothetical protein
MLWRSTDSGITWSIAYTAAPRAGNQAGFIGTIGFDERAPSTVYLSSTDGFSISRDVGDTWQTRTGGPAVFPGNPVFAASRIESDPRGSGALIQNSGFAATLSRDQGATWTVLRPPVGMTSAVATFSRTREGRIYVGIGAGSTGSLWVSDDWGRTWSAAKAQPPRAVVDLFTDPDAPDVLYAVILGWLLVSEDGGESWIKTDQYVTTGNQISRASGCGSGALLVTTVGWAELTTSSDRGRSWAKTGLRDVKNFSVGAGCALYALKSASGDGFVARLDRMGAIQWSTYLGDLGGNTVTAIATDSAGSVFVTGTTGGGTDILIAKYTFDGRLLWLKTMGGDSWDTPLDMAVDQEAVPPTFP